MEEINWGLISTIIFMCGLLFIILTSKSSDTENKSKLVGKYIGGAFGVSVVIILFGCLFVASLLLLKYLWVMLIDLK